MNEESLKRANAFLAAVAARVQPGELFEVSPSEIGKEVGLPEPLAAARAVRALLARRRLEAVDGKYRLVDARPLEPGEREQLPRRSRKRTGGGRAARKDRERPSYTDVGQAAIERLVELGREVATVRAGLRAAREEARDARRAREEAERRAESLAERARELEARLEMAESNLRTILTAARGSAREDAVTDSDMEAILGVLRGSPGVAEPR